MKFGYCLAQLSLIEKQSVPGILHYPSKSSGQVFPGDGTATNDDPIMRQYFVELQSLSQPC